MAADWIKMRVDLLTHPKVVRILSATRTDKFRVVGGLHAVWSIFDTHSVDGRLKGYTPELLDHVIGWEGFARAMEAVGWLTFDGLETLALPEFDAHNGQSAKRRAEDQKRKRNGRNRPQSVHDDCGQNADKKRTREREEKRREEKEEEQGADAPAPKSRKRPETTIADWLATVDGDAIPADDPVFEYAAKVGIPADFLLLAWTEFEARHLESGKRYKDWRAAFRKCVRDNWYRLWWVDPRTGDYALTTQGVQAQRAAA
jgi:hypothetical protein